MGGHRSVYLGFRFSISSVLLLDYLSSSRTLRFSPAAEQSGEMYPNKLLWNIHAKYDSFLCIRSLNVSPHTVLQ